MKAARRLVLAAAAACAALALLLPVPAPAQERRPLLIEGKRNLYQRVISRPGATLTAEPRQGTGRPVPGFSVYYVYERREGFLLVGAGADQQEALAPLVDVVDREAGNGPSGALARLGRQRGARPRDDALVEVALALDQQRPALLRGRRDGQEQRQRGAGSRGGEDEAAGCLHCQNSLSASAAVWLRDACSSSHAFSAARGAAAPASPRCVASR